MSKLSLVGGDSGIGEVLLHAPQTDETRIYDFPDETGTFALREHDIANLEQTKANRAGDTFTGDVHFEAVVTLQAPTDNAHAATKKYVDDQVSELSEQINTDISVEIDNINTTLTEKLVLASSAEAIVGTDANKLMTPSTTKAAIDDAVGKIDLSPYFLKTGGTISGNVTVTGTAKAQTFQSTSDVRNKENIEPVGKVLDKLQGINLYRYNFIGDDTKRLGLVAQEVVKVFPEVVTEDEDGYLAIDYNGITAILLEALKELADR